MQKSIGILVLLVVLSGSCKKDPNPDLIDDGKLDNSVDINITNMAGNKVFAINTGTYMNQANDTFYLTTYRYYISNIKLKREDGFIYSEPKSYRIIEGSDSSACKFSIKNVPLGNYSSIEFILGVDSIRNCSGAQTGELDPVRDMFWSWNQGYIFGKMEGYYRHGTNYFQFHIGGFKTPYNAIVKSSPSFNGNKIQVTSRHVSKLYLKADLLEWFRSPFTINLDQYTFVVSPGTKAKEIAMNYSDMFSVAAIKNE